MTTALDRVDWHEVARSFVEDATPTPAGKVVPLGIVLATPGVLAESTDVERAGALARHARGDWGDVGADDWAENELPLAEGYRLLSEYRTASGVKFWVITEADRSATTLLLPEED